MDKNRAGTLVLLSLLVLSPLLIPQRPAHALYSTSQPYGAQTTAGENIDGYDSHGGPGIGSASSSFTLGGQSGDAFASANMHYVEVSMNDGYGWTSGASFYDTFTIQSATLPKGTPVHVVLTYFFEGGIQILTDQPNYGYPFEATIAYSLNTGTPGTLDNPPDVKESVCAGVSCPAGPEPNSTVVDTGLQTVESDRHVGDSFVLVVSLGCSGSVANCQANDPVTVSSPTAGVTFVSAAQSATNTPTLATQLSQTDISPGSSVSDTATLSSAVTPTGKIAFYVSNTNACPNTSASQVGGAVTVTGDGSYPSPSLAFSTPGTYYWYATYTGDSNNNPVTSPCEPLIVGVTTTTTTSTSTTTVQGVPEFGNSAVLIAALAFIATIMVTSLTSKVKSAKASVQRICAVD